MSSLPKTVTRQRRDCDLNPGPSAPESNTLTTRLPSQPLTRVVPDKGPLNVCVCVCVCCILLLLSVPISSLPMYDCCLFLRPSARRLRSIRSAGVITTQNNDMHVCTYGRFNGRSARALHCQTDNTAWLCGSDGQQVQSLTLTLYIL